MSDPAGFGGTPYGLEAFQSRTVSHDLSLEAIAREIADRFSRR